MIIHHSNRAITLIEMIIAVSVVGILMLGMITLNGSLQRSSKNTSGSYFAASTAQTVINYMLQDAALAVGTKSAPGIMDLQSPSTFTTVGAGNLRTTCFYQQATGIPWSEIGGGTAKSVCYTYPTTVVTGGNVFRCEFDFIAGQLYSGSNVCSSTVAGYKDLGPVWSVAPVFTLNDAQLGAQEKWFEVSVVSCLNPSGGCVAGNSDNPYVEKSGRVSPSAHSM